MKGKTGQSRRRPRVTVTLIARGCHRAQALGRRYRESMEYLLLAHPRLKQKADTLACRFVPGGFMHALLVAQPWKQLTVGIPIEECAAAAT